MGAGSEVDKRQDDDWRMPQDVAASEPAADCRLVHVVGEPEVTCPTITHGVEEVAAHSVVSQNHEPPWGRVVRSGCGGCRMKRGVEGFVAHRGIGERSDGAAMPRRRPAALEYCLVRAKPEQVLAPRAHEGAGSLAMICRDRLRHSSDHRNRHSRRLALDEVGSARDLIGCGDDGHLQGSSVGVGPSGVVIKCVDPGSADRVIGEAVAPRPSHRVGDDDPYPNAELSHEFVAKACS
ncbi:unannotated protein [freshwater metagenome]|uniref:Unannotated protein n=1 Tax=freshwater metagenome TaxID=449393 RepID=A0A6J7IXN8_9ZZZZ